MVSARQVIGGLLLLVSLWMLYVNIKPYFDAGQFWLRIPWVGPQILMTWWILTFGFMTAIGVALFITSLYLVSKR